MENTNTEDNPSPIPDVEDVYMIDVQRCAKERGGKIVHSPNGLIFFTAATVISPPNIDLGCAVVKGGH